MHLPFKNGPQRAKELGCKALQVFCGNPRAWRKAPLDPQFLARFRSELAAAKIEPLIVHATYLLNLATPDERLYRLSRDAFIEELRRSSQLGARYYVIHCGHHKRARSSAARRRVAACLREALAAFPLGPEVLLENSAGSGTELGAGFEELADMLDACQSPRAGLCLDTCHALAAGHEIRTPQGAGAALDSLARTVGLERLRCLHLNDSKGGLGSHLDRHQHIGRGCIGEAGFRAFLSDSRLWHLPAILETPKEKPGDDPRNLRRAVALATAAGATL
ncbi:MAG: deoxyribonuclease IV [Planctomycetota bacterium]